jgi:hypothetical protein
VPATADALVVAYCAETAPLELPERLTVMATVPTGGVTEYVAAENVTVFTEVGTVALGAGTVALGAGAVALGAGAVALGAGVVALGAGVVALGVGVVAPGAVALTGDVLELEDEPPPHAADKVSSTKGMARMKYLIDMSTSRD